MTNPLVSALAAPYCDCRISGAGGDAEFAKWIGRLIAVQGKSYIRQDEDFRHEDFMGAMDAAFKSGTRRQVVPLLPGPLPRREKDGTR